MLLSPSLLLLALAAPVDFARDVRPLLAARCVRCHGPKKQEGGLRLDLRRAAFAGGDAGPALVPGSPEKSGLLHRVEDSGKNRMPPSGKALDGREQALLRDWIAQGATWPDDGAPTEAVHWSFRPIRRPVPPGSEGRSPLDAFLLPALQAKEKTFSPEASPSTLLRRLHLDLTGLPPTPEEVAVFVSDKRRDAYERLADRLLASPHFGERWGRHWLDLARYAESDGYENDRLREGAWLWRDWVVSSFNADQPFDQFTVEQLAGDLLPKPTPMQKVATGLHRNTLHNSAASGDKEEFRTRAVKDRAETTATAWLGLTLGCAQCHSHKYDPVSQKEYYRIYAFFDRTGDMGIQLPQGKALGLRAVKRVSHVHRRGDFLDRGEEAKPGTPEALPRLKARGVEADRLDLAHWLVSPEQPLTARVAANRVWQHLFGEGLVRTPENFGKQGSPPTHPDLLDWLASELRDGWSRKRLIRAVILSRAYRQSSVRTASDPENRLVGRQQRGRLEAEVVRDAALAVAGLLDNRLGGPSIVPPFPKELPQGQFSAEALKGPTKERHRRGIYVHIQRTLTHPSLAVLDAPDGNQPCPKRDAGCSPVQALALLNDPVFAEAAQALGRRLVREATGRDERLALGFRLCLARTPDADEKTALRNLVSRLESAKQKETVVWAGVARVLLNLDEFVNRE